MHYRFFHGNWSETGSDDLYDSVDYATEDEEEDSFEALCRFEAQSTPNTSCSSLDSWLKKVEYPASSEEAKQDKDSNTEKEDVPDLVSEENGNPLVSSS